MTTKTQQQQQQRRGGPLTTDSVGTTSTPPPTAVNLSAGGRAAGMQRRLSCASEPMENRPYSPSRTLSQNAKLMRRTSAQESVDSAFLLLLARRKGSDSSVGQIQPHLYSRRSSVLSVGSNGVANVLGRVQLQLSYDHTRSDLVVRLLKATLNAPFPAQLAQCRLRLSVEGQPELRARDCTSSNNSSSTSGGSGGGSALAFADDGQWVGQAAADNKCQQQPKLFKLPLCYHELVDAVLLVELISAVADGIFDGSSTRYATCSVPLGSLGPSADELTVWADLEKAEEASAKGELLLCLQYLPSAGRLTLSVHQASNFRHGSQQHQQMLSGSSRYGQPTELFVRAQLMGPDEKVLKRRKTAGRRVLPGEPVVWDEVLGFEKLDPHTLARCRLDVQLFGSDRFGRAERLLGGMQFCQQQQQHFHRQGTTTTSAAATMNGGNGGCGTTAATTTAATRLWRDALNGRWTVPRWIALNMNMASGAANCNNSRQQTEEQQQQERNGNGNGVIGSAGGQQQH